MSRLVSSSGLIPGIIEDINIRKIRHMQNSYRSDCYDIQELASSIKVNGLLHPIVVRSKDDHFEVVAGNRRMEACKSLGWRKITCHVMELDNREAFEISLIENVQRKSLNPIEEGRAFKAYIEEFGWGGASNLAAKIGKSISYVEKRLRILGLPNEILQYLSQSRISSSIAEELSSLPDKNMQSEVAKAVTQQKLSFRQARTLVNNYRNRFYNTCSLPSPQQAKVVSDEQGTLRPFNKCITALRIALCEFGCAVDSIEDDWIAYEILMQHKNMLNMQIDLLIREKKKKNKMSSSCYEKHSS